MIKSLRWRLQLWYALILLLVVASFGGLLYWQHRKARMDEIDAELQAAARVLEGALRNVPMHLLTDRTPPPRPNGPPPPRMFDGPDPDRRGPPPGNPRNDREVLDRGLTLPGHLFHRPGPDVPAPYFAVWLENGRLLKAMPAEQGFAEREAWPMRPGRDYAVRQRGPFRELALLGPQGTLILVGRAVDRELDDQFAFAGQLALTGLAVWVVGLTGGWFLSRRVLRPITAMSTTASAISASNLSHRIDLGETESELGQLATVLNHTFDRLQTAFEQQVRFTADASHELRTPVTVILTHAELALARERSAEDYRKALQTCQRAGLRMRAMIESLLTLARMDAGELGLQMQAVDLGSLAGECLDLLRPLLEQRRIAVQSDLPSLWVLGDPERLAQVLVNLLTNAIIYNRDGGYLGLTLALEHDQVRLAVTDTGVGIPAEELPHLFERFYRVDKARTPGGTGLGLAICQGIVTAHAGTITVSSQVNVGTTFTVHLPAAVAMD